MNTPILAASSYFRLQPTCRYLSALMESALAIWQHARFRATHLGDEGPSPGILLVTRPNDGASESNAGSLQESARKLLRSSSGSRSGISCSTSSCMRFHSGSARARRLHPSSVSFRMRVRRSDWSLNIFTNPRRSSGFRAAVKVVRSIASRDATGPIDGGSGRFSDIKREN